MGRIVHGPARIRRLAGIDIFTAKKISRGEALHSFLDGPKDGYATIEDRLDDITVVLHELIVDMYPPLPTHNQYSGEVIDWDSDDWLPEYERNKN